MWPSIPSCSLRPDKEAPLGCISCHCTINWLPQPRKGADPCAVRELQAGGPSGMRLAELLDLVNAQASVRVTERELRQALGELEDVARVAGGVVTLRA